mmetsp:Transcript_11179/g.23469  ORF Transcript_11179/g.23469 Transcript_11179/m.23469 type:complete len:251 (-) Transcript_11179:78-830(-)
MQEGERAEAERGPGGGAGDSHAAPAQRHRTQHRQGRVRDGQDRPALRRRPRGWKPDSRHQALCALLRCDWGRVSARVGHSGQGGRGRAPARLPRVHLRKWSEWRRKADSTTHNTRISLSLSLSPSRTFLKCHLLMLVFRFLFRFCSKSRGTGCGSAGSGWAGRPLFTRTSGRWSTWCARCSRGTSAPCTREAHSHSPPKRDQRIMGRGSSGRGLRDLLPTWRQRRRPRSTTCTSSAESTSPTSTRGRRLK